jgi:enoyl-CoA hydratase
MSTNAVTVNVDDHGVALVTLTYPPVNAFGSQLRDQLRDAFDAISDRSDVRVAVLTGEGRIFCAGADLKERGTRTGEPGERWHHSRQSRECFHAIVECQKPVIAALNGPALGAGLAVAASCDIIITSEKGSLGLPEINVGLLGGGRHCMRLFGHSKTRRMMFTGYRVEGAELFRLGVAEACVAPDALMDEAMGMARDIAGKSPTAMRLAKHALNTIEEMSLRDGYRFEQNMTASLANHPDSAEAMRAFVEKRPAVFESE